MFRRVFGNHLVPRGASACRKNLSGKHARNVSTGNSIPSPRPGTIVKYRTLLDPSELQHHAVEEYPTANGPADYALFVNGKLLGIIEAKKVSVGPQNVLEQAKRYARGATTVPATGTATGSVPVRDQRRGYLFPRCPREKNVSRKIASSIPLTPWRKCSPQPSRFRMVPRHPVEIDGCGLTREGHHGDGEADRQGQAGMLVAMATGTGKTFMTVAQIYRLLESKAHRGGFCSWWTAGHWPPRRSGSSPPSTRRKSKVQSGIRGLQPAVPTGRLRR